jgi:hypothetical protein
MSGKGGGEGAVGKTNKVKETKGNKPTPTGTNQAQDPTKQWKGLCFKMNPMAGFCHNCFVPLSYYHNHPKDLVLLHPLHVLSVVVMVVRL